MTYTKSEPPKVEGRGRKNENLRKFKAHLKANPGESWEYDEIVTYNIQAPENSGYSFTCRSAGINADGKRIYRVWGRFDPVSSENAQESS